MHGSSIVLMFALITIALLFTISARGVASKESSGHIANIAESAARLNPNNPAPVISIESEGGYGFDFVVISFWYLEIKDALYEI